MARNSRRYPKLPILGTGALIFRRNRILLIERGREPQKGYWSIPGGGLETGERLEEGLVREVREETGLEVKPMELFTLIERIIPDAAGRIEYHYVIADYFCRVTGGVEAAGDDVTALAWASEDELGSYKLTEGTLPILRSAFRRRRQP